MRGSRIPIDVFRTPPLAAADDLSAGVWIKLHLYCADQLNGGRIAACKGWSDRVWDRTCGTCAASIEHAVTLDILSWDGDALVVHGYAIDDENGYRAKIDGGRKGGQRSAANKEKSPTPPKQDPLHTTPYHITQSLSTAQGMLEDTCKSAPMDLPPRLMAAWKETATEASPEVATKALEASRRIFPGTSEKQYRQTYQAAAQAGVLDRPSTEWPDFRQSMKAEKAKPGAAGTEGQAAAVAKKIQKVTV